MIMDNENKVVLPDFVAEYIEQHHDDPLPSTWDKADFIRDYDKYISIANRKDVADWLKEPDNFLSFVIAVATENYIVEQPKKYYWRKRKKYLAWFEDERNLYLNKSPNGSVRLANIKDFDNWEVKFTEEEAQELLKKDFYMFEKLECD